jgi:hypothetical protein
MRTQVLLTTTLALGMWLFPSPPAVAQGRVVSDAECQNLRQRLADHARLSNGVQRFVAAQAAATAPAASGPQPATQDVDRIKCEDVPAALDTAVRIRREEDRSILETPGRLRQLRP